MARHVGRKTIRIPTAGDGESAHSPERISAKGTWAVSAHFFAPSTNEARVYIGWAGTSAVPGNETSVEITPGDNVTLQDPERDDNGKLIPFDLYDLFVSGTINGDGLTYFTW